MERSDSIHPNDQLRQERIARNWRQQDLADQVGTTVVTVTRWERGKQQPSAYFRVKLCALFGKSVEELGLVEGNLPSATAEKEEASEGIQISSSPIERPALWTVPYRRNLYFTGRDELFHLLDQHLEAVRPGELTATRRAALTQPQALKGLGGIGKTQIAVEYAYRAREQGQYTHTLWINAASKEAMMTSFTALADVLPEFPAKDEIDQQKLVEAIKRWLEQCQERWLLIFDNADDLSLVQECVPQQGNGSILLTTRVHAVGLLATSIDVEKMGFVEGTHLLLRRAQRLTQASDEEVNEAGNIVVALDHFPLALEQAGAYIEETGCGFGDYLRLYQTHRKALLTRRGAQSTNYPDSVATTWLLSFDKVEQANPAATELLRLCAFLAPDHIPEELITNGAPYWPLLLQKSAADLLTFNSMIEDLLAFSLLKRFAEDHILSIHRLVQAVQMDMMDPEEQRQWAECVIGAVDEVFPRDPKEVATWPQCLRHLEQAQMCSILVRQYTLLLPEAANVLARTGIYLSEHASYTLAEPLYQQVLWIWEYQFGSEHPQVGTSLTELATLYRKQGKYEQAESLYKRAARIWEQALGPEHPELARALQGLASIYLTQGKYEQAKPLYERALRIWEQVLGPEHPQTASPLNNLALLYFEWGKYEQAKPLYERALRIWEQALGPEHPQTASPLNNLALLYYYQGKYEQAELLARRALHVCEEALGSNHPDLILIVNRLANLCRLQGKYEQAEPLYEHALHISEEALGPEHLITAQVLCDFALFQAAQGKNQEAEPLYERALRIREQQMGPEHLEVAFPLNGLADLYRVQGQYAEAELLYQQALTIREQAVGEQHPDTAETLHGLAALRESQGSIEQAASLYHRALRTREKVYGPQHPKTIDTGECLCTLLQAMGKTEEAAELSSRLFGSDRLSSC